MARPVSRRGEGRERVVAAALELFARHGVSGTSLHMIAESLGVTKASVYFQFRSKSDLVVAVLGPAVEDLAVLVEAAEARTSRAGRLEVAVPGLIDLVVRHRRLMAILRGDPAMRDLHDGHPDLRALVDRLSAVLLGPDRTPAVRVNMSMVGGGLMLAGADPDLADLDDDTLRTELLRCARALLG
jgi:AcrR family transcriptional regulator